MAGLFLRAARCVGMCTAIVLFGAIPAGATEPDAAAIDCLISVLRTAGNAISVKPAGDTTVYVEMKPYTKKGVDFSFRSDDGTLQTIGVYLSTEFALEMPRDGMPTAMGGRSVPSRNGRFALTLRPPYPPEWYPPAREVVTANTTILVRQDSKKHPLYGLWERLAKRCRIDNQVFNAPSTP